MSAPGELVLVGHRGYPLAYPENTLLGYDQAAMHGATWVETDVQCTRDRVPVLYHDRDTRRLSGVPGTVHERTLEELGALSAHHPRRFGDRFAGTPIPTLKAFAGWLKQHPAVTAFVEIKAESLEVFGIEAVVERVMEALHGVVPRSVVISFDDRCVEYAAARYGVRTGWVLPKWNAATESRARALSPDYLLADRAKLARSASGIWRGPWEWAVYVVDDIAEARSYPGHGVRLVETDAIGEMLGRQRAGPPA